MDSRQHDCPDHSSAGLSNDALKVMMDNNISDAESIYALAKEQDLLDSQEFIDWQDRLNAISVLYQ